MNIANDPRTFTVETMEGRQGVFLCIDNGKTSIPIAKFLPNIDTNVLWDVLSLHWKVAQTQGRMGI